MTIQNKERNETLTYIRQANVKIDGSNGFLFLHRWETGFQYLIFSHMTEAMEYLNAKLFV